LTWWKIQHIFLNVFVLSVGGACLRVLSSPGWYRTRRRTTAVCLLVLFAFLLLVAALAAARHCCFTFICPLSRCCCVVDDASFALSAVFRAADICLALCLSFRAFCFFPRHLWGAWFAKITVSAALRRFCFSCQVSEQGACWIFWPAWRIDLHASCNISDEGFSSMFFSKCREFFLRWCVGCFLYLSGLLCLPSRARSRDFVSHLTPTVYLVPRTRTCCPAHYVLTRVCAMIIGAGLLCLSLPHCPAVDILPHRFSVQKAPARKKYFPKKLKLTFSRKIRNLG